MIAGSKKENFNTGNLKKPVSEITVSRMDVDGDVRQIMESINESDENLKVFETQKYNNNLNH